MGFIACVGQIHAIEVGPFFEPEQPFFGTQVELSPAMATDMTVGNFVVRGILLPLPDGVCGVFDQELLRFAGFWEVRPGQPLVTLQAMAQRAYTAHPEPIPYESPRYRDWADLDRDGYVAGAGELLPLYLAAARDFAQPLFAYGPPRLARLGVEVVF